MFRLLWILVKKQPKPSPPLVNESTSPVPFKKVPWKRKTSSIQSHPVSATYSSTRWNSDPVERDGTSVSWQFRMGAQPITL